MDINFEPRVIQTNQKHIHFHPPGLNTEYMLFQAQLTQHHKGFLSIVNGSCGNILNMAENTRLECFFDLLEIGAKNTPVVNYRDF